MGAEPSDTKPRLTPTDCLALDFVRPEGGGEWFYKFAGHPEASAKGLTDALALPSLGLELPLGEIYRLIELEPFVPPAH